MHAGKLFLYVKTLIAARVPCEDNKLNIPGSFNPSNAETTSVQSTRTQRFLKTI